MQGRSFSRVLPRWEHTSQYTAGSVSNQRRTFTSSIACQRQGRSSARIHKEHLLIQLGAVPKFQPTSSPELDILLSTFRDNVFLPAHLSKQHLKLVYGTKYQKDLETTPVMVNVAGEEFRLKHIDRTKDLPNQRKGIREALRLMEKKDWDNFPLILEGLTSAGRRLNANDVEKYIRSAGRAGRQDVVVESVRRVAKTGLRIDTRTIAKKVMWWIQYRALANDFSPAETKKALSMAEQVAVLMEDEKHAGGRVVDSEDPRTSPEVIGNLLELSAANAKQHGGKDEDGSVEKYAKKLLASLRDNNLEGMNAAMYTDPLQHKMGQSNGMLRTLAPILYGVRTAASVLGPNSETAKGLRDLEKKLAAQAAQEVKTLRANPGSEVPLGLWAYDKIESLA